MMPAIHSMRLADRPSRSALMIGTPPATAASNATITPFFCAAAKIWLPCVASSALFAVTTCLPWRIASSTRSLAMVVPPISSTTISISGERTSAAPSEITLALPLTILLRARNLLVGDHRNPDRAPGAALDLVGVAAEHLPGAAADRADAEQADVNGLHFFAAAFPGGCAHRATRARARCTSPCRGSSRRAAASGGGSRRPSSRPAPRSRAASGS